jgi:hypothetical protein
LISRFDALPWWLQIPVAGGIVLAEITLAMFLTGNGDQFLNDLSLAWRGVLGLVGIE